MNNKLKKTTFKIIHLKNYSRIKALRAIKVALLSVFSVVELPKNTKKSNYDFWSIISLFGHFRTLVFELRARISGKHHPKVKFFAKFELSVSDLTKKSKIAPKKLFWPIFIFLLSFLTV
jgi:hypothetical protein